MKVVPLQSLQNMGGLLAHGSWDLCHYGHLKFFTWVRSLMDGPLTVTLTADKYFASYKGNGRPAFPEQIRADWLSYVGIIDHVAIVNEPTGVLAIKTIKPTIYAKGAEAEGLIADETAAVIENGGSVVFMPKESLNGQIYSSGRILSGEYLREKIANGS